MSNYINGIPSSMLGYGPQRQQFQSYDGVLSGNESNPRARRIETLQKRLIFLEDKYNVLLTLANAFSPAGKLVVENLKSSLVNSTNATITNETTKIATIHNTEGNGIVMNDRPLILRGTDDVNRILYNGDTGVDGLSFVGNKGGALGYIDGTIRRSCLDWGSERIRSPKTFQANTLTVFTLATDGLISVTFPVAFKFTPVVIARPIMDAVTRKEFDPMTDTLLKQGTVLYHIRIESVSTTGFTCRLMSFWKNTLSPNEVVVRPEPYGGSTGSLKLYNNSGEQIGSGGVYVVTLTWQAFDPTDTNIYTT
jgi:hypothetical protein